MTLVELRGASFGYGGRPVVRAASFSVSEGEFLALSGPNGAGKSTLLRGLVGLLPPISGKVARGPALPHGTIGWVPQRDSIDPVFPMTALDVVRLGAGAEAARRALSDVGLSAQSGSSFAELSGGQRQRVLLARALAGGPKLVALDEPTAGIDPESQSAVLALLERLRAGGLAIVMVTHHAEVLRPGSFRGLRVEGGTVREVG